MSNLKIIHELLREEYAVSRHIWWLDAESGKLVNDVTYCLLLIRKAAECIRRDEEDCWRELAAYAVGRSMSYLLMHAIGEFLLNCGELTPLPLIDLAVEKYRNWQGGESPLLDETERLYIHALTEKPEPDRKMAFKHDHHWSRYKPRMRDTHPAPEVQMTSKSVHWLF
ncbi:MAG: hypothetical protein K8L91_05930 [Anaerolineae bacterium]|nr:hypothetical protein [Anaerolineae bacterium]